MSNDGLFVIIVTLAVYHIQNAYWHARWHATYTRSLDDIKRHLGIREDK